MHVIRAPSLLCLLRGSSHRYMYGNVRLPSHVKQVSKAPAGQQQMPAARTQHARNIINQTSHDTRTHVNAALHSLQIYYFVCCPSTVPLYKQLDRPVLCGNCRSVLASQQQHSTCSTQENVVVKKEPGVKDTTTEQQAQSKVRDVGIDCRARASHLSITQ